MNWINAVEWGSIAEWANAIAVIAAAVMALGTLRGYRRQRAAEKESDLALAILEAIYRFEPAIDWARSSADLLDMGDANELGLTAFQVSNRKLDVYERQLGALRAAYRDLISLLPSIRAIFGKDATDAASVLVNSCVRIFRAVETIRAYNIEGQNATMAGREFVVQSAGEGAIGPEQIRYQWTILLEDGSDSSGIRKETSHAKSRLETMLLPIVRASYNRKRIRAH